MIGNNTLRLNESTVVAALQHYFDAQFIANKVPLVKGVRWASTGGNGEYVVGVTEPKAPGSGK